MPIANSDVFATPVGQALDLDILANDEGKGLTLVALTNPVHGVVALNPDQTLRYTPKSGFVGLDGFTYTLRDEAGVTASATARIAVGEANQEPLVADDQARATHGSTTRIAILDNDWDPDGDPLRLTAVTSPSHGAITIAEDQSIHYTPSSSFVGLDGFTYTVGDGRGAYKSAHVEIDVLSRNSVPTARVDTANATAGLASVIDVLSNDDDEDDDPLTITSVGVPKMGSVEATSDQKVRYIAADDATGQDNFGYTMTDGRGGVANSSVNVNILSENADPNAIADTASATPGQTITISPLANDNDPDGDALSLLSVTLPTNGRVVVNADQTIRYTANEGFIGVEELRYTVTDGRGGVATAAIRITVDTINVPPVATDDSYFTPIGQALTIDPRENDTDPNGDPLVISAVSNPANGTVLIQNDGQDILYTPNANFAGQDSFTYTITDGRGGTDTGQVAITVREQRAPVAQDDAVTTAIDSAIRIDVARNDSDPDGDSITVVGVPQAPTSGLASIRADGQILYTPNVGFEGEDSFVYRIRDPFGAEDTATVTVSVGGTTGEAFSDNTFWTDGTGWA